MAQEQSANTHTHTHICSYTCIDKETTNTSIRKRMKFICLNVATQESTVPIASIFDAFFLPNNNNQKNLSHTELQIVFVCMCKIYIYICIYYIMKLYSTNKNPSLCTRSYDLHDAAVKPDGLGFSSCHPPHMYIHICIADTADYHIYTYIYMYTSTNSFHTPFATLNPLCTKKKSWRPKLSFENTSLCVAEE